MHPLLLIIIITIITTEEGVCAVARSLRQLRGVCLEEDRLKYILSIHSIVEI